MANLKIFVSSTCYDLQAIRGQLRGVLSGVGYEPVMSDHADVIYDPRVHTHASCLREVQNCDMLVLVMGTRFGGTIVPKALEAIDLAGLEEISRADGFLDESKKLSITQAEVLQAIQFGIPVFAFVDAGVMRDHLTYEKNKKKPIISEIEFSSIDKNETAPYIFEFINFLRLRSENNSIFEFSRFEDIEYQLKKQWSGLFQRLLLEQRTKAIESRRIDNLSSQIADLKAAVLGSISNTELKETAKGAIRFRQMIEFVIGLVREPGKEKAVLASDLAWDPLLKSLGICEMRTERGKYGTSVTIILLEDGTYFRSRLPPKVVERLSTQWQDFIGLSDEAKRAIIDAVLDSRENRMPLIRHHNEPYLETQKGDVDDEFEESLPPAQILLTEEKFIEDTIRIFLTSGAEFRNMRFMVEVKDHTVRVSLVPKVGEQSATFEYTYETPDDHNLSGELERLKERLRQDIVSARKVDDGKAT
ncbi:DUF4062 domain-containing protein [Cupriavidus pinatubonensis]|uniref:DUF4062 domain-containing protein n=1 Tax=Cupriavidus pinatubonensis TaxID=248026 RepID=UPI003614B0F9